MSIHYFTLVGLLPIHYSDRSAFVLNTVSDRSAFVSVHYFTFFGLMSIHYSDKSAFVSFQYFTLVGLCIYSLFHIGRSLRLYLISHCSALCLYNTYISRPLCLFTILSIHYFTLVGFLAIQFSDRLVS